MKSETNLTVSLHLHALISLQAPHKYPPPAPPPPDTQQGGQAAHSVTQSFLLSFVHSVLHLHIRLCMYSFTIDYIWIQLSSVPKQMISVALCVCVCVCVCVRAPVNTLCVWSERVCVCLPVNTRTCVVSV